MQLTRLPAELAAVLTAVLVIACAPAPVVSTPGPTPVAGNRIRYAERPDSTKLVTGRVVSFDVDRLVVARFIPGPRGGVVTDSLATDSLARLQVHVGRRGHPGRGVLVGGVVGLAIGIACASEESWLVTSEQCVVGYTVIGAGMGLLIGTLVRSDVWARATPPARTRAPPPARVSAAPGGPGVRIPFRLVAP
jgi:hypothetical protein